MRADQAGYDLASREAGTLTHRLNLTTGEPELLDGVVFAATPVDENERTFWQTNAAFPLAYLPDDLATGVVLLGLPGMALSEVQQGVNRIAFRGAWPHRLPFRLAVKGLPLGQKPVPPAWTDDPLDPTKRCLAVELPPACQQKVRVSCALEDADLERMALWDWAAVPPTANHATLLTNTHQGRNWELMPYREIKLVHAVQKPLRAPAVHIPAVAKDPAATAVTFNASLDLDAASTGKVNLLGLWKDPVDDPAADPAERASQAVVGEWQVVDPAQDVLPISGVRHDLGDTHYHAVTYVPRGATRFREYMPQSVLDKPELITAPTLAEIQTGFEQGTLTTGQPVDVLNSARPAAPVVKYVLPTFGKVEETFDTVMPGGLSRRTRVRRGNGLRVYLERPWFSSGAGELLGVVFQPGSAFTAQNPTEAMQPFVTQWANDPIWASAGADLTPTDANFVSPAVIRSAYLEENGAVVRVAGYPTEYVKLDEEHKLRYADILLDLGAAYTPMIRLALVRLQPKSVNGETAISRVVRTDFCQVLPDRTLTLTKSKLLSDPSYHLKLEGLAPAETQRGVRVRIEEQVEPGEFGWRQVDVAAQPQASAALWEGNFVLPQPPSGRPHRVVVEEFEVFEEPITTISELGSVVHGRTVYADIVEL